MTTWRLRHLAVINPPTRAFEQLGNDDELTFLPMEGVWPGSRLDISRRRTKAAVATGYTRFQDGDVLVPKITPTFEASRSVLIRGLHNGVGAGTTELHVLRPGPKIDPRFLLYAVNTHRFLKLGEAAMYGVAGQQRVPDDFLRDLQIDLPQMDEQRRIADFLDGETTRIGHLIQAQQRVALLAAERDQVTIELVLSTAATGRVKLKRLLSAPLSYGANAPAEHDNHDWPRYIRTTDIATDGSLRSDTFSSLPPSAAKDYELRDGDLLFVRSGATVGKNLMYRSEFGPAAHAGYLIRARIDQKRATPKFVWYFCQTSSYWQQVTEGAIQATIQNVNAEKYGNILVPAVSLKDQQEAVSQLDHELEKSCELKRLVSRQVELLAERRQALITAAVAGEIDVSTASGRGIEDGLR